jgi:hypothetical protein
MAQFRTLILLAALSLYGVQVPPQSPFEKVGHVQTKNIDEVSGSIKSTRYPDTYWVHNDSGDSARIFAIHADGSVIAPPKSKTPNDGFNVLGAFNTDWEDITSDGDNLYISDMGNNHNDRRDLAIYVLPEPNPYTVQKAHVLKRLPVVYPDQTEYPPEGNYDWDCEAIFYRNHKLWFVTKHRLGSVLPAKTTCLYVMETQFTDKVNVLRKVDERKDMPGWVTGAAMSPDGKTLAVLTEKPQKSVTLFDVPKRGFKLLSQPSRRLFLGANASQCESICFDGNNDSLIVTNEQGDIMRVNTPQFSKL